MLHSTDLGTSVLAHYSMCIVGETSFSPLGSKREKGGSHSFLCSPDPYISKIFQQLLTLNFPPPPNSACHRISLTQYILFCRCLGIKQQTKPSSLVLVIFLYKALKGVIKNILFHKGEAPNRTCLVESGMFKHRGEGARWLKKKADISKSRRERAEERRVLLMFCSGTLEQEYVKSPSLSYVVMVTL